MYDGVMLKCWSNEKRDRPTFSKIVTKLESVIDTSSISEIHNSSISQFVTSFSRKSNKIDKVQVKNISIKKYDFEGRGRVSE
jgi:hypothetical protein